jgi:hypothetical protein
MGKSTLTETEKGKAGKEQSQEHAHNFPWHQGDYSQEFILRGHIDYSWYCSDILCWQWKYAETFDLKFGDKRTGCCITATHHLTLPILPVNSFIKYNMTDVPHPSYSLDLAPYNFSPSLIKDKTKAAIFTQLRW